MDARGIDDLAIFLRSVTTFSEPPVNCDTPLKIAAAIRSTKINATKVSARLLVRLLETPIRWSIGAAK
jgi:hypothetical protein